MNEPGSRETGTEVLLTGGRTLRFPAPVWQRVIPGSARYPQRESAPFVGFSRSGSWGSHTAEASLYPWTAVTCMRSYPQDTVDDTGFPGAERWEVHLADGTTRHFTLPWTPYRTSDPGIGFTTGLGPAGGPGQTWVFFPWAALAELVSLNTRQIQPP